MRRVLRLAFPILLSSPWLPAQAEAAAQTPVPPAALFRDLAWRGIGPANMMGRIAAIDALHEDARVVLVGSASGGVFLSRNAGVTWQPIFDDYGSGSIGAVKFCQCDPKVIWVGTGEAANRNSSGWGDGIYKSEDGGKTFRNLGLKDTHQIAEIAVHPRDRDVAYVAAIGHLWGRSGTRGLFATRDGGKSWRKLAGGLPQDPALGATDVEIDPQNPDVLYVGMYARLRQPWSFRGGSKNGGIYKSEDAGKTWRKLRKGLPSGATGQIDIAIHLADPKILVAAVEADENLPSGEPGSGVYRSDDGGATWRFLLKHHCRPFYHGQIEIDPQDPQRIFVVSREFRVSLDGGKTFRRKWWGGGGDDHDMWISPRDPKVWYNATDQGAQKTNDGGRTITFLNNMAIGQYYAIGVDMRDPYWIAGGLQDNGLWLGPSQTREPRGILNMHNTWIAEGDGFHTQIDPENWRTIYVVNHVGFAARLDALTREHAFITPTPETVVNFADHRLAEQPDPPIRYTIAPGEQWFFGYDPQRAKLPPQFRFNWSSPLVLAPHNSKVVYFGGNHLFRSEDRGARWRIISPDLTTNDIKRRRPSEQGGLTRSVTGGENFCTIITIGPSPVDPAVIWVGTDDGNVQVTRDGGGSWRNVAAKVPGVPAGTWVSRVEPSRVAAGRAYVTFDNHRRDDNKAYLYVTNDFGETWRDLSKGLPDNGATYVVREDPVNPRLLFVGTEFGVWASVDGGASWAELSTGMPTVAAHDLVVHPRDGDLVCGTHGRSIWVLDDVTALQQFTPAVARSAAHLFAPRRATLWQSVRLGRKQPYGMFRGKNPPRGALLHVWLREAGAFELVVEDVRGEELRRFEQRGRVGLQRIRWDLRRQPSKAEVEAHRRALLARVAPGTYRVRLVVGGKTVGVQPLVVRADPLLDGETRGR